jgi:hypothetical protein
MERFNRLKPEEQQSRRKQYTRDNRELWKQLGYRMMSSLVHDDEREEVLAELEVRRCMKAVDMAEDKTASSNTISRLGSRNINAAPTLKEMGTFKRSDQLKNALNMADVEFCVDNAMAAMRSFQGCMNAENRSDDETVKWRMYAKQVAYGNLAAAWWKLAQVRFKNGDKKSVFMAREPDAEQWER